MAKLTCEICGGQTLVKENELYRCNDCGACYDIQALKDQLSQTEPVQPQMPIVETTTEYHPPIQESAPRNPFGYLKNTIPYIFIRKIDRKRILPILGWVAFAAFIGFILFVVLRAGGIFPNNSRAKELAKREVADAWHDVDEDLKLVSIDYDSVTSYKWSEKKIEAYLAECGNNGITDINGRHYDTHWEYWEEKGYDPYNDTWRFYTVKGDYRVKDGKGSDFEGYYIVCILHRVNENTWHIESTEIEVPEELRPN